MLKFIQDKIFSLNLIQKFGNSILLYAPAIFSKQNENIKNILKHSLIINIRNNMIMGSLFLIIVKFLFVTNFEIRLFCLIGFSLFSAVLNLRERIKIPLSKILMKLFGWEYFLISVGYSSFDKPYFLYFFLDLLNVKKDSFKEKLQMLRFEISYFIRGLFFQLYTFLVFFRFIFDLHPYRSIIIYYIIIINILYYDVGNILLYIGGFLTLSKLIVYHIENSFQEVKQKIYALELNEEILEKELTLSRRNRMIFVYWTLRDIGLYRSIHAMNNKNEISTYIELMLQSRNELNLLEKEMNDKLDLIFKKNSNNYIWFVGIPFKIFTFSVSFNNTIANANDINSNIKSILKIGPGHKFHLTITKYVQNDNVFYRNELASYTSIKGGHMLQGSISTLDHRDSKDFATALSPIGVKITKEPNEIFQYLTQFFPIEKLKENGAKPSLLTNDNFFDLDAIETISDFKEASIISDLISIHQKSSRDIKSEGTVTISNIINAIAQKKEPEIITGLFKKIEVEQISSTQILQNDINSSSLITRSTKTLLNKLVAEHRDTQNVAKAFSTLIGNSPTKSVSNNKNSSMEEID